MYEVDQRVTMSVQGMENYPPSKGNPHHEEGTIIIVPGGSSCRVRWDNGQENTYGRGDMTILGVDSEKFIILRKKIKISRDRCRQCRLCMDICPAQAIESDEYRRTACLDKCSGCGLCIKVCPDDKISWVPITVPKEGLTDEDKDRIVGRFPKEPRVVQKANGWFRDRESGIKEQTMRLAKAIDEFSNTGDDHAKGDVFQGISELRRHMSDVPMQTLGEAAKTLRSGLPNVQDVAKRELEGVLNFFDHVTRRGNTLIAVTKKDSVVEGVNFGKFRIELHLPNSGFNVTAVAPNWASEKREAPHPHIEHDGGGLCLGDGSKAYDAALREGRLCDVLLIIQGVLNSYGDDNPYHNLKYWSQKQCYSCHTESARYKHCCVRGANRCYICEDHAIFCSQCGKVICTECLTECDECKTPLCLTCAQIGCEHKGDVRNTNWQRRAEDARQWQAKKGFHSRRGDVERLVGDQMGKMGEALEQQERLDAEREEAKRREEEERRKESEMQSLRAAESERFHRLPSGEQKKYVAGHESDEGYAGFVGGDTIDTITEAYAPSEDAERARIFAEGTCPRCGDDLCQRCECCHECSWPAE